MIASFIDGRIRLRDRALKDPANMDLLRGFIGAQRGILDLRANSRTGSLLVYYDPTVLSREALASAAALLEPGLFRAEKARPAKALFASKESLLLALVYCAVAATGFLSKPAHLAAGTLFTLLTAAHVCRKRGRS
jgi:hypothetical protein